VALQPVLRQLVAATDRAKNMRMDWQQLKEVRVKIRRIAQDIFRQGLFNLVFASPFGCWPFLQANSSYWLPVAFFMGGTVIAQSLYTQMPVARKTSSKPNVMNPGMPSHRVVGNSAGESSYQFSSAVGPSEMRDES